MSSSMYMPVKVTDPNGCPADLTGWEMWAWLGNKPRDTGDSLVCEIADPLNGTLRLSIPMKIIFRISENTVLCIGYIDKATKDKVILTETTFGEIAKQDQIESESK